MSRLPSRLAVTAFAALESVASLGRRRLPGRPRRILIAHHLLLGDILMLTPLLAKLRQQFPEAEIVMTVPKAAVALYAARPYGVRVVAYSPRRLSDLLALRRQRGFDLAIVPGDNRHSWLARALGARWIIAHGGDRPAHKSWPVDQLQPLPDKAAAWGDMVAELVPGPAPAAYAPADWPAPPHRLFQQPAKPYCVLHLGASTPLKQWRAQRWQALAARLRDEGYQVVWSGGPGEEALVNEVDPQGRFPNYAGQLDLAQLWQLLADAELLVCPDTSLAHLGRLTGTPTVALFGPGSAVICGAGRFWQDSAYRAVAVEDFPCRNQQILFRRQLEWVRRCGRTRRQCAAPACMEALELDPVWEAAAALLRRRPAA